MCPAMPAIALIGNHWNASMNSHPTSQQYRKLAEGLLKSAIGAPYEQKQVFIRDALAYLVNARAQDDRCGSTDPSGSTNSENQEDVEGQYRQVEQLIKQALEVPTPEELKKFLDFSNGFRRNGRARNAS